MSVAGTRNVRTKEYKGMLESLPENIQALAAEAFRKFKENPLYPALSNHELKDNHRGSHRAGSRSVYLTLKYRAIYVVDGDTNVWYWIGSHNDYNLFTGQK